MMPLHTPEAAVMLGVSQSALLRAVRRGEIPHYRVVQALLGHATLDMTMEHYKRAIPERQAEAVAELERRATEKGVVQ